MDSGQLLRGEAILESPSGRARSRGARGDHDGGWGRGAGRLRRRTDGARRRRPTSSNAAIQEESLDLGGLLRPPRSALLATVVLRRHQFAVPVENRVRRRYGRHLLECLPTEHLAHLRQAPTFPVRRIRSLPSRSSSAAFSARWYAVTRVWCNANHIPIYAARNRKGRGSAFTAITVVVARPIRPFYAPR
jgi:hypothetical protein